MQLVAAFALIVVLRAGLDAGPGQTGAEAELEALLAKTTPKAPMAEVRVVLEGPDATVYRLEESTVTLDGVTIAFSTGVDAGPSMALEDAGALWGLSNTVDAGGAFPMATVLDTDAGWPLSFVSDAGTLLSTASSIDAGAPFIGTQVPDGDHVVTARLVYRGQPTGPYPWQQGPRWVLPGRVPFQASHGLRFTVRLVVEMNAQAPAAQRLVLRPELEPEMVAALDDAPLPPPPLPRLPPAPVPTSVTASAPPLVAAPATPLAATPTKKKPKKKVARVTSTTAGVPASAKASKAAAVAPGSSEAPGLEEATARLRSALAAPLDAGAVPVGATRH